MNHKKILQGSNKGISPCPGIIMKGTLIILYKIGHLGGEI
jgi:hypothetical protein